MRDITTDSASIFEAQTYLNKLHYTTGKEIPIVNPDGIFGKETTAAVRRFQELFGLPITGEIDLATWNALYESYLLAEIEDGLPTPLLVFPNESGYKLEEGERSDIVFIVQFILRRLSNIYPSIKGTSSGIYDEKTTSNIREFQKIYSLPQNGIVDKITWNALARAFNENMNLRSN